MKVEIAVHCYPASRYRAQVMAQLRSAGVLETVKIRQCGYPWRLPHGQFWATCVGGSPRVTLPLESFTSSANIVTQEPDVDAENRECLQKDPSRPPLERTRVWFLGFREFLKPERF